MQIIHSNSQTVKAFAITLPSITVITALLIINLESIMAILESTLRKFTSILQEQMRSHHRTNWKSKAHALQQDHLATKPPSRKATRQSSHWVYILFVIEAILVLFPVSEVARCISLLRGHFLLWPKGRRCWAIRWRQLWPTIQEASSHPKESQQCYWTFQDKWE